MNNFAIVKLKNMKFLFRITIKYLTIQSNVDWSKIIDNKY